MKYFITLIFTFSLFLAAFSQNEKGFPDRLSDDLSHTFESEVDSLSIGCRTGVETKILPDFRLTIEEKNKFNENQYSGVDLFGIRLEKIQDKKRLIAAIDEYCIYGWANYYFESNDFLIFSYSFRSFYFIQGQRDNQKWQELEDDIKNALNDQTIFQQDNKK